MKFHQNLLNCFQDIVPRRFCHKLLFYKVQRDITKRYKEECPARWFSSYRATERTALYSVLGIAFKMSSHEDILNGLKVIERTQFCQETATYKVQKGYNSKNIYPRVMVLAICTSSNVG